MKSLKPAITKIPTVYGNLWFFGFKIENQEIIAIANKKLIKDEVNLRLHSCCFTSEIFGSLKCDCAVQLENFLKLMATNKKDNYLLIYFLHHEGRGIGIFKKLMVYEVQRKLNLDTYQANEYFNLPHDSRDYNLAIPILRYFKIKKISLYSNNPDKVNFLRKNGFLVKINKFFVQPKSKEAIKYLLTKVEKGGHLIRTEIYQILAKNLDELQEIN
jgi:3,4-dihydroxy 2-butanone 4-phosphate synthase/GTP cyclohydrolase II